MAGKSEELKSNKESKFISAIKGVFKFNNKKDRTKVSYENEESFSSNTYSSNGIFTYSVRIIRRVSRRFKFRIKRCNAGS